MNTVIDKKSGFMFCLSREDIRGNTINTDGLPEYNLIKWCEQYVTADSVFVDIGADIGAYTVLLSKCCSHVYCFEKEQNKYQTLAMTISINNIFNATASNGDVSILDKSSIKNVSFIHIGINDTLSTIKECRAILENYHPHILFLQNNEIITAFLKEYGYEITPVMNSGGLHIAGVKEELKTLNIKACDTKNTTDISCVHEMRDYALDFYNLAVKLRQSQRYSQALTAVEEAEKFSDEKSIKYINYEKIILYKHLHRIEDGLSMCEKILWNQNYDWNIKNITLGTLDFFLPRLPIIKSINIPAQIPDGYVSSSSSIMKSNQGYKIILRTVNYYIGEKGSYHVIGKGNKVNTRNFLLFLDMNFNLTKQVEMLNKSKCVLYNESPVLGIEDVRGVNNSNWFLGCCRDTNSDYCCQMCIGTYKNDGTIDTFTPISDGKQTQKNWLPFDLGGKRAYIYGWNPLRIFKIDKTPVEIVNHTFSNVDLSTCRGSAPPIPYNNGYLCIVHLVHYNEPRKYYHRFVWLSSNFKTAKFSIPFYVIEPGIEYILSICQSDIGLLMAYSFRDSSSRCLVIKYDVIEKYLQIGTTAMCH
jgi:hypothetical protein